jgi:hypothetical protein
MNVASLVFCCTAWFDSLMIYPPGSKHVGIFSKVHPRTDHEVSEGSGEIALPFLKPRC